MTLRLSRRNLLQGTAVTAVGLAAVKSFAWAQGKPPQQTVFSPGILGGGGFVTDIVISPDGTTRLTNTDTYGCYGYNSSTGNWDQLFSSGRVPSAYNFIGSGGGGNGIACYAVTCAPSLPTRLYAIPNLSSGAGLLWRSDDRGLTWANTGHALGVWAGPERLDGPKLVVDPNNPDVVYWGNSAGIFFRSIDGGVTIYDSGPITALISALANGTTSGSTSPGGQILNFNGTMPAAMPGFASRHYNTQINCYNTSNPASVGDGTTIIALAAIGSATLTLYNGPRVTVNAGDVFRFGSGPSICFDPTSGTTTLGGVTVTKTIFFGWTWGGSAIWKTMDGGSTFSAFGTGPTSVQHMVCSSDGVFYVCDSTPTGAGAINVHNFWRYVGTPPAGSGLSENTWTNFTSLTNFSGNSFHAVAADPTTPGRVATSADSGNVNSSQDYGATWINTGVGKGTARIAADSPWLQNTLEAWMGSGNICFDPVVSNKLWFAEGIGIWHCTCPSTNVGAVFHSETLNNNEIIFNQIVKVPGGPIIGAVQDRAIFVMADPKVGPTNSLPPSAIFIGSIRGGTLTVTAVIAGTITPNSAGNITDANSLIASNTFIIGQLSGTTGGVGTYRINLSQTVPSTKIFESTNQIKHSWCVEYAKTNPSFLSATVGNALWTSADGGVTWINSGISKSNDPQVACQSSTSMVLFPIEYDAPYYTTDGTIWNYGSFSGWPYNPSGGWSGNHYSNRRFLCADLVNSSKYYAYNQSVNGVIAVPSIANGGTGYAVNDTITLTGGAAFSQAALKITSVSGGVVTGVSITNIGGYRSDALPRSPMSQGSTSGSGRGATFNVTIGLLGGLWMSSDGGATWTQQCTTFYTVIPESGYNATLVAVPGNEGHLLWAPGTAGNYTVELRRSGDGGRTWHNATNVNAAWMVTCGRGKPGNSYPAVYMIGKANGDTIPGVYRSDDFTTDMTGRITWTLLTNAPVGSLDGPHCISGDLDTYGTIYIGFGASGYAYGKLS